MEENTRDRAFNCNANKLLTGNTNAHFVFHLWELVRKKTLF